MRSPLVSGPLIVVYINGRAFARVQDLSYRIMTPKRQIHCVDMFEAFELAPLSGSVSGSITVYRLHRDGGIEGSGLQGTWNSVVREKYFSLTVVNRLTDTVIFSAPRCSVEGQDWRLPTKAYAMGVITFSGISAGSDAETAE